MDTYDTDRAGLVSTAQLALEQSKHEGHARRTRATVEGSWLIPLAAWGLVFALAVAACWVAAGAPPISFNAWSRS